MLECVMYCVCVCVCVCVCACVCACACKRRVANGYTVRFGVNATASNEELSEEHGEKKITTMEQNNGACVAPILKNNMLLLFDMRAVRLDHVDLMLIGIVDSSLLGIQARQYCALPPVHRERIRTEHYST
jgi:hypothetical protein